jgi:hypothetical protein
MPVDTAPPIGYNFYETYTTGIFEKDSNEPCYRPNEDFMQIFTAERIA